MIRLHITLPADRTHDGTFWAMGAEGMILGPSRCRGKSDNQHAMEHGNAARDPLRPYGDTPLGVFRVIGVERGKKPERSYGPAFLRLRPVSGQAWDAMVNGKRDGLGLHGGDLAPDGHSLRPTDGCPRVDNTTCEAAAVIVENESAQGREVFLEIREEHQAPEAIA